MYIAPISSIQIKMTNGSDKSERCNHSGFKYIDNIGFSEPVFHKYNVLNVQSRFLSLKRNITFEGALAFKKLAANELHPEWKKIIAREIKELCLNIGSIFLKDADRIVKTNTYSNLTDKTQVFLHPNSLTSTRMTHTQEVTSLSEEICDFFGLNSSLAKAIAMGHDTGHVPFGHAGERALNEIIKKAGMNWVFWHGKNGIRFLDDIERINLTYAVRDGILCHSFSTTFLNAEKFKGSGLKPRDNYINLRNVKKHHNIAPFTWEGCVVKIADDISSLGKDIEDAINMGVLAPIKKQDLIIRLNKLKNIEFTNITRETLLEKLKNDLFENSNPTDGMRFSENGRQIIQIVEEFIYENIHKIYDKKHVPYIKTVLNSIFDDLSKHYGGKNTLKNLEIATNNRPNSKLLPAFRDWLIKYSNISPKDKGTGKLTNIYNIHNHKHYKRAIIEFIASMTDTSAINAHNEITATASI